MKRLFNQLALITVLVTLGGCYYDPGYNYVRGNSDGGDAYYGTAAAPAYVVPSYYTGYGGYGYGGYGCCYTSGVSIGISNGYYPYRGPYYGYYGGAVYRGNGHYRDDHHAHGGGRYDSHYQGGHQQGGHQRPDGYPNSGSAGRPSSNHQQPPRDRPSSYQRPPAQMQSSPHVHASEANPRSSSYPGTGRKAQPHIREDG